MINDFVNSLTINSYQFSSKGAEEYELNQFMKNSWPVVYIIKNERINEAYIGESTNAINRMKNHLSNAERQGLNELLVISCDKFNKSAVLDIESQLISYMDADKQYKLQNGNAGLVDHNYYQKPQYRIVFKEIWKMLLAQRYAKNPIERLDNTDFFKYSPYKSLNGDQHHSVIEILKLMNKEDENTIFVEGGAGTGKSVLAVYLMKLLKTDIQDHHLDETDETYSEQLRGIIELKKRYPDPKVALVIPMTSLRKTLQKVFRNVKGLSGSMVIGPTEVSRSEYDILLVDEAHRLRQRKGLTGYGAFDNANRLLGFDIQKGTELDWVLKQSKHQIFFYDEGQSIKPTDIGKDRFISLKKEHQNIVQLVSQMRVKGGTDYINFIDNLLHCRMEPGDEKFKNDQYELKLYDDLNEMHADLKKKEKEYGLCRMLAGYSWPWQSKSNKNASDIEIDGAKFKWNTTNIDWINSPSAIDEIGCIHTSQGYDLNFAGVIIGNEIEYDPKKKQISIDASQYYDSKGKQGISDPSILKEYILNIYKTMMLRGIRGTYVYVCNTALKEYLAAYIQQVSPSIFPDLSEIEYLDHSKIIPFRNSIPLFDLKVAAGEFGQMQSVEEVEWIIPPLSYKPSESLFACTVIGESMNKVIPNGSICLFRKYSGGSRNGKIVLAEQSDLQDQDLGSCYTIKEYHSHKVKSDEGWEHEAIILKPLTTNSEYDDLILDSERSKSFRVIGIFECVLGI